MEQLNHYIDALNFILADLCPECREAIKGKIQILQDKKIKRIKAVLFD